MVDVIVQIALDDDSTLKEMDRATSQLITELKETDADTVQKVRSEELNKGAKGDPITIGAIALAFGSALAPDIIKTLIRWVRRRTTTEAILTIKIGDEELKLTTNDAASAERIEILTQLFKTMLEQHAASSNEES